MPNIMRVQLIVLLTFFSLATHGLADQKINPVDFGSENFYWSNELYVQAGDRLNAVFDLSCLAQSPQTEGLTEQARLNVPAEMLERAAHKGIVYSAHYSAPWIIQKTMALAELEQIVNRDPCLVRVAPDRVFTIDARNPTGDPDGNRQEHLNASRWSSAYGRFEDAIRTHRPIVAVIDTGTEIAHPDLKENIWVNTKETAGNGVDDDGNGFVDDVHGYNFADKNGNPNPQSNNAFFFHGTHVAGLIAARSENGTGGTGIHGWARILPINVFGSERSAHISTIENAIRYAVDNGATVINLSIGGSEFSSTMLDTLKYATKKGAFIVSSAGNEGVELSPNSANVRYKSPAIYGRKVQGMLTVTSVDVMGGRLSTFANFGMFYVELAAPGAVVSDNGAPTGLLSTYPGGGMGRMAGTSMAAPLVSGAAAIVQSWMAARGKTSTPAAIETILLNGSRQNDNLMAFTRSGKVLDFQKLMDRLEGRTSPVIDGGHLPNRP